MLRILLVIAVIAIGYDAVVHQGAYTRSAWAKTVGATEQAVEKAQQFGRSAREEVRTSIN